MCHQMSDKAVADGPVMHPGRFELGPRWCSLLLRTVRSVNVSFAQFLSEAYLGVADAPPERPGRSVHR
jgi:hypothetical protein